MALTATSATNVRWRLLGLAMAASFANQFNRISMPVAADLRIMDRYAISPVEMGMIYSAFLLGYTVFMTPGGWLIDRLGPRLALSAMGLGSALFVGLTGTAGLAFASGGVLWWALVGVRGAMGACSAPVFPASAAFTRRWFPPGQRALANGLIVGASPLGVALTYPAFGFLVRRFDWPVAFFFAAGVTAALALIWAWMAADTPTDHPSTNDAERVLTLGDPLEITLNAPDRGWRTILADRGLWLVTASYTAVGYFDFLFFYWMNYYFTTVLALADAAWYASLPPLAMALGIPLGGWASDRLAKARGSRARGWVAAGGMVASAGFLLGGVLAKEPMAIVAWFSMALGAIGLSESTFWVVAVDRGGSRGGTAAGLMNTGGNLGGMIAPALTPWVALRYGWSAAIALGGLIGLLGAACWLFVPSPSKPMVGPQDA